MTVTVIFDMAMAGGSPFCLPACPAYPVRCGLACVVARASARAAWMLVAACLHGGSAL